MIIKADRVLVFFFIFVCWSRSFALEAKILASDGAARHRFGFSVEIDSTRLFVGAPGMLSDGDFRGAVYIYEFSQNELEWIEVQKLDINDEELNLFGASIAQSDSFLIVGVRGDSLKNPFGGAAFLYRQKPDHSWELVQQLFTPLFKPTDMFGFSVAIDGNYAAVGAPRGGGRLPLSGSVYIYHFTENAWILDAKLVATAGLPIDGFGSSVSLAGNRLIVGASGVDGDEFGLPQKQQRSGNAYIFERDEQGWHQVAQLTPLDGNAGNMFGRTVVIDGDYAAVGAVKDDVLDFDDGSVYVYKRDDSGWNQEIKLTALDADSGDHFGAALDLEQNYLVVGAPGVNGLGQNSGAVYSFLRTEEGWSQRAKKMPYDAAAGDFFGAAIGVSEELSIIGAPHKKVEEKNSQGVAYVYDNIADLALPVELASFTATCVETGVRLTWLTQSEKDNLGFILERQESARAWEVIASYQTHEKLRGQGFSTMPTFYEFLDDSVQTNRTYHYRLADVNMNGTITYHEPITITISAAVTFAESSMPGEFKLYPAFPNPFNPQTMLRYNVPYNTHVHIAVYDMTGRRVRTLLSQQQNAGFHSVMWEGTDEAGELLSSGVYIIQCHIETIVRTQKVLLLH